MNELNIFLKQGKKNLSDYPVDNGIYTTNECRFFSGIIKIPQMYDWMSYGYDL